MTQFYAAECTANPIWLLQVKRTVYDPADLGDWDCDDECWRDSYTHKKVNLKKLEPLEEIWETIEVFHSRELATQWAKARHYDWGKLGKDCRVYSIGVGYDQKLAEAIGDLREKEGFKREAR